MKTTIISLAVGCLVSVFFLSVTGCGSADESEGLIDDPLQEEAGLEEPEPEELCLSHMDCYDPEDDTPGVNMDELGLVSGVPAPGSQCPVPEPYGFEKGDRLENIQLVDSQGNPFYLHDRICGSTVGWVYFYRGPS